MYGMRIDPSKMGDAKVFLSWRWTVAHILSEEIKEALERIRAGHRDEVQRGVALRGSKLASRQPTMMGRRG
jgi:hypothetical protein